MTEATKRGRPRTFTDEQMCAYRSFFANVHTDRQIQNLCFAHDALRILRRMPEQHPPPSWLVDWAGVNQGKQGAVKFAILEQLGRMAYDGFSDDQIRDLADDIEQWKPKAKVGAAYLRDLRRLVLPVPRNRRLSPSSLASQSPENR